MRRPKSTRPTAPEGLFTKGERRKLVLLTIAVLVVAASFVTSLIQLRDAEEPQAGDLPEERPAVEERVVLPDIDPAAVEARVADAEADERVVLEREGVEHLLGIARALTPAHYRAMEARTLDAELAAELLTDPPASRAEPFVARGWVREHRVRSYGERTEHHVRLTLDDGTTVYAVTLETGDVELREDDSFVRVDGLFLKAFSDETETGWVEGPLLVGRTLQRSYPELQPIEQVDQDALMVWLADVEDFSIQRGATGLPFHPLWRLMALARDLPEGAVDWDGALELDATLFGELLDDGQAYRGVPFRIPISKLMGVTVKRMPENPARLERITEGWIGNNYWPHLIHFRAPFAKPELRWKDLVSARGFFFKNFAYDSKEKDVQVAPVFVLHSLERFVPPEDDSMTQLFLGVAVVTLSFLVLITFLVTRDRRRSRELRAALIRRRRERRAQAEGSYAEGSS